MVSRGFIVAGLILLSFAGGIYVGSPNLYKVMPEKHTYHLKYCDPIPVDSIRAPDKKEI